MRSGIAQADLTAHAIAQAFAQHTAQSAQALGLHVKQGYITSRLELRDALTGQRLTIGKRIPNSALASAIAEALAAIAAERKRLAHVATTTALAERPGTQRRGPQADRDGAPVALAHASRAS